MSDQQVIAIIITEEEEDDPDYPDCSNTFRVTKGPGTGGDEFPYGDSSERRDQLQNARKLAAKYAKETGQPVLERLYFGG